MTDQVRADPAEISKYAAELPMTLTKPLLDTVAALAQVTLTVWQAFGGLDGDAAAGPFPEGQMLADTVDRMHGYFQQLASDAERGLTAIANAAQVCADAYRAADMASAESVNLVGFAFAHPDATARPPGLSSSLGPTLSQQPDLQPVDAARGDLVPPARVVDAGGTTYKYYPDGSRTEITKSTAPATANSGVVTTTTTRIYRPGAGELVGEQVSTFEQRADGVTVTRTTAAGMTTTVTKHPDGSARIETTVDDHTDVKELPAPPHPDQPASGADATPGADADSLGPQTSAARDLHLPSPAGA